LQYKRLLTAKAQRTQRKTKGIINYGKTLVAERKE